ncbi:MAG TPA: sulfite exporter TauE/SafE family protein [Gaiellaceae bacterium]|nr:sulfite exporter TauE/SafE family protein [Gaiellaceae bacterium]
MLHRPQNTAVRLLVIGLLAGVFSALFGVGGGIVVVPLLILLAGYTERPAMGTSLAAILLIALVGAVTYALHGEVKPGAAAVVGIPGALGAVAGASLQQRLANRTLSLAFSTLLAVVGIWLLV